MERITLDFRGVNNFIFSQEIKTYKGKAENIALNLEENKEKQNEMLGWMDIYKTYTQQEIDEIKNTAKDIQNKCDVFIVIGIGGSYLGARAVIEALTSSFKTSKSNLPEIIFAGNNMSGKYLEDLLEYIKDKEVCINVISKSGKTLEPAIAFRTLKKLLEEKYGVAESAKRIIVTTDKEKGILKDVANKYGYKSFVIPDNVGGRYSVLTPVGLLPIAVAGIDIQQILIGMDYIKNILKTQPFEENDCMKYAIIRNILNKDGKDIEIMSSFEPRLHYFIEWFKQLFGESEGKNLKGIFPVGVDFSTDLHSLGQIIQEGKRNIFETNLHIEDTENNFCIPKFEDDFDSLSYLEDIRVDDINEKAFMGTMKAHIQGDVPCIVINIPKLNEFIIGQLIFFFEKSCAISAGILGVNAFDQPGVEAYKGNMMELINKYKKS